MRFRCEGSSRPLWRKGRGAAGAWRRRLETFRLPRPRRRCWRSWRRRRGSSACRRCGRCCARNGTLRCSTGPCACPPSRRRRRRQRYKEARGAVVRRLVLRVGRRGLRGAGGGPGRADGGSLQLRPEGYGARGLVPAPGHRGLPVSPRPKGGGAGSCGRGAGGGDDLPQSGPQRREDGQGEPGAGHGAPGLCAGSPGGAGGGGGRALRGPAGAAAGAAVEPGGQAGGALGAAAGAAPGRRTVPPGGGAQGEPSGKRKREAKLDRSLPPGTRLLTASLLRGADPVAPAGLAVALAQGKGSVQLERWELICQAAQDNLELRGLEALPLRQDDGASPAQFGPPRAAFEDLWRQMAQAGAVELRRLCRQLGQFQKSLSAQLEEPEDESDAGERGLARCLGAYAAAARCAGLALVEGGSWARKGWAVQLHQAVSWLMHGFAWAAWPRVLLDLRRLSLQLLEAPDPGEVQAPPRFPCLSEALALAAPYEARLVLAKRPRFCRRMGLGQAQVEVRGLRRGLRLVEAFGSERLELEVPDQGESRCRVLLPSPELPATVQLFLDVDAAAAGSEAEAGTGLEPGGALHRQLNLLPLTLPQDLGFE
ncbi:unnamed protein product [Effrenium voratum]|uniref:Uncharacterized protein n=1 Tax=Effrenium voratum TaxID=2562239 RepID=A0AA36NHS4_9DINO|nr:unnamed protein product [Effrenium voratum]